MFFGGIQVFQHCDDAVGKLAICIDENGKMFSGEVSRIGCSEYPSWIKIIHFKTQFFTDKAAISTRDTHCKLYIVNEIELINFKLVGYL